MKHRAHQFTLPASRTLLLINHQYFFLHFRAPLFYVKSVKAQGVSGKGFIFVLPLGCFAVLPSFIFDFRLPIYDLEIANCKSQIANYQSTAIPQHNV